MKYPASLNTITRQCSITDTQELCFPAEVDITDVRIEGITLSLELATMLVGELNSIEQLKIEYEEELIAERYEP